MKEDEDNSNKLPDISDFYLNVPLYKSFTFNDQQRDALLKLYHFKGHIDCYCISCQQPSVFHTDNSVMYLNQGSNRPPSLVDENNRITKHKFSCSRNEEHQLFFFFLIHNNTITKIGQYPSLADLAAVEIRKYRTILGNDLWLEFSKAVGLTSYGIGIGAFVYLRRIFENLVEDAHQKQIASNGWDEDLYKRSRMDEKISLLRHPLPDFLVKNKSVYSILSKGIHELKEDECLDVFPIIKLGIELILDEKSEQLQREKKIKLASKEIGELNQRLKSTDSK
ncbi:MAG: hypothetical protein Q8O55_04880 [Dehalococcoidales bacterium]|nr:hypothetical protein [Dehalococcoidales bacterium]